MTSDTAYPGILVARGDQRAVELVEEPGDQGDLRGEGEQFDAGAWSRAIGVGPGRRQDRHPSRRCPTATRVARSISSADSA
ncbi:hypothetical protein ACF08O_12380 [Streptomyces paradoxus]|uniref:hypothetical protein n=1 Tax=Streptomyces paradoxus TaxID=66375 RepID=UPI0036FAC472